jgi:hypothetical protein
MSTLEEKNCSPAGYVSAAKVVCGDDDVFTLKTVSINHIL